MIRDITFYFWNTVASAALALSGVLLSFGRYCADKATQSMNEDNIK